MEHDNSFPRTMLVTGAGGFVGAGVVRNALDAGLIVHATGRTAAPFRLHGTNACYHQIDLEDHGAVSLLLEKVQPDVIVHTAWAGVAGADREASIQFTNLAATYAIVDAAIASGVRKFVGIGSQAEYGAIDGPVRETAATLPRSLYGAAKLSAYHLARQRCEAAGLDFAWLRLFATYGPYDNPNWLIPSLVARMAAGEAPAMTLGTQKWDYLFNDDTAAGIVAAAMSDNANGVFNLSSGRSVPVRDIATMIRDRVAPGLALQFGAIPFGALQIMHLAGDNSALREATGWAPSIGLEEGINRTIATMRATG